MQRTTKPRAKKEPAQLVATEEQMYRLSAAVGRVIGAAGTLFFKGIYNIKDEEEYVTELSPGRALRTYNRMMRNDGQIQMVLNAIKLPILSAQWDILPPGNESTPATAKEKEVTSIIKEMVFERPSFNFQNVLAEASDYIGTGFYPFEKIYGRWKDGSIIVNEIQPRIPFTINEWEVKEDKIQTITQDITGGETRRNVKIPRDKLVYFVFNRRGADYRGRSVLRAAYKHWYFKDAFYRVQAVAIERQGVGIPKITLSATTNDAQKTAAITAAENLRAHEKGYVLLPNGITFEMLDMGSNKILDPMDPINHHDQAIPKSILAQFLELGMKGEGARALGETLQSMFLGSIQWIADDMAYTMTQDVIGDLVRFNFGDTVRWPYFKASGIEVDDLLKIGQALQAVGASAFVKPDDDTEAHVRNMIGFPEKGEETEEDQEPEPDDEPEEDETEDESDADEIEEDDSSNEMKHLRAVTRVLQTIVVMREAAKTLDEAKKKVSKYGGEVRKIHDTGTSWRFRQRPTSDFMADTFRTFKPEPGVSLVYGTLKAGREARAKDWVVIEAKGKGLKIQRGSDVKEGLDDGIVKLYMSAAGFEYVPDSMEPGTYWSPWRELRPTEEYMNLREMVGRMDDAREEIVRATKEERSRMVDELIPQIAAAFEKGDPTKVSKIDISDRNMDVLVDKTVRVLLSIYDFGRDQVSKEIKKQKDQGPPATVKAYNKKKPPYVPENYPEWAKSSAEQMVESATDRIVDGARTTATDSIRSGTFDALVVREELESGSLNTVRKIVSPLVNEGMAFGREAEGAENMDDVAAAEYTAIMDSGTCGPCSQYDGQQFEVGSPEYERISPPNVECESNDGPVNLCRCAWFYILKSETAPEA